MLLSKVFGMAFSDRNADGAYDPNDWPLLNTIVFADLNDNQTLDPGEAAGSAGQDGSYSITLSNTGLIHFRAKFPTGYTSSSPATGYQAVQVATGFNNINVNFGAWTTGSVSGFAFYDTNLDGQKAGEVTWPSQTIYVDLNQNNAFDPGEPSKVTDASTGYYQFDLKPGTYRFNHVADDGYVNTSPPEGYVETVTGGLTRVNLDFGVVHIPYVRVDAFYDANGNGIHDGVSSGDHGANNLAYVDMNENGQLDPGEPAGSGGGGSLTLKVPAGTHTLHIVPLDYDVFATPASIPITIKPGDDVSYHFAITNPAVVHGVVFDDANGNQHRDEGEAGLAGVTAWDDANFNGIPDAGEASTTTDARGYYAFVNPSRTTFNLNIAFPEGWFSPLAGETYGLGPGQNFSQSWPLFRNSVIRGVVNGSGAYGQTAYLDLNGNQALDPDEPQCSTSQNDYGFAVTPGTYTVRIATSAGRSVSSPASNAYTVTVGPHSSVFAGSFSIAATPGAGTYAWGQFFDDRNRNGSFDPYEAPVSGRTFYVDLNKNGILDAGEPSAMSDKSGVAVILAPRPGILASASPARRLGRNRRHLGYAYLDLNRDQLGRFRGGRHRAARDHAGAPSTWSGCGRGQYSIYRKRGIHGRARRVRHCRPPHEHAACLYLDL